MAEKTGNCMNENDAISRPGCCREHAIGLLIPGKEWLDIVAYSGKQRSTSPKPRQVDEHDEEDDEQGRA